MDVIGVWAAGVREVVATCGTALTSQQIRALRRHSGRMVVNFDSDSAGVQAAERSIQMLLEEGMHVRVLELGGGLDPDQYVKEQGAEAYRKTLDTAPGYFHWLADRARAKFDTSTAEGRVAGLQFLIPAIQRVSDKLERAAIASEVATYLRVEAGLVLDHFRKAATERRAGSLRQPKQSATPLERILLNALLSGEKVRARVVPRLKDMPAVQQFSTRRIFQALFAVNESKPAFGFAELEARVEENDKDLLALIAFADETHDESYWLDQAESCLRKLEEGEHEARRTALKVRIREAERSGDFASGMQLMEELARLDRP
jgi:DNA primase